MPGFNRTMRARLMLFGIFILLDICVFILGIEEPPLPEAQNLKHFNGQVVYFFEGSTKSGSFGSEGFLIIKINNDQHAFYLGFGDSLSDTDSAYIQVRNSIRLNDSIRIKGYFNEGRLGTYDYYNIVELERNGRLLVTYDVMAAAIEAENQFNYMLFFGLNFILLLGFSYLLISGSDDDDETDSDSIND